MQMALNLHPPDYILIFDNGRPLQMQTEDRPSNYGSIVNNLAFFVKDSWRMGRFTANLGLRWERFDGRAKDVDKPQGTFGGAGFTPGFPVYTWTSTTPRL